MTVAMEAPKTSKRGNPKRPKIRIGSKIILMMATGGLGNHGINGFSCGLQQSFKDHLTEQTEGKPGDDAQIVHAVFNDLRVAGLNGKKPARAGKSQNAKSNTAEESQKNPCCWQRGWLG